VSILSIAGQMPASVSPTYLLEGAAYALEQCGLLLRDANLLYRNGSYASAVAVALFAREELGRYQILLELRRKAVDGGSVTIKEIQDRCRKHVTKQEAGMLSFVMRVTDTALGGLLGTYLNVRQGSEEWNTAREQLEQAQQTVPVERHKQRMSSLYVDAVAPDRWNRPTSEISQITALAYLQDAANDYSGQWDRYTDPKTYNPADPELYTALENWPGRPTLASPERPFLPPLPPWLTFKLPS
jgi:AbiV family abortive infection protein